MDAVELLKGINRICEHYLSCDDGCPLKVWCNKCLYLLSENPEEVIEAVEKWSAEHPIKTRQSEFLKMFPNASIADGVPELNPCHVDNKFSPQKGCGNSPCVECRKEYWSEEVE